jgi:hypothetical protein
MVASKSCKYYAVSTLLMNLRITRMVAYYITYYEIWQNSERGQLLFVIPEMPQALSGIRLFAIQMLFYMKSRITEQRQKIPDDHKQFPTQKT